MGQTPFTLLLDDEIKETLDGIKTAEGIPLAAQIRFALLEWLERRGHNLTKISNLTQRSE